MPTFLLLTSMILFCAQAASAGPAPALVRQLAPGGRLRVAINLGNPVLAQRAPSGELGGVSVELARELGRRLRVPVELIPFDGAGKVVAALREQAWDVAFLAIDPLRADVADFSHPYVVIEGAYLVPADSPLRAVAEVDRPGVRVAVGRGSAYDLFLTRELKQARRVEAPTSAGAVDLFLADRLEVAAGVRQPLAAFAATHPGVRLLPGSFMVIRQAMAVPRGREGAARYLDGFIEELKASGFVAKALARSGQGDAAIAPAMPVE
ncbi:MAG: ABC transporter substrate-binding protein [Holophaga sp.]|nr:ABC transporter substrate-binding protein [Holophaga sp.]